MKNSSRPIRAFWDFIASTKFFILAVALFCIGALWLAFSAVYPLPFDEYYHYGIMSIYAQQWSPFIHHQPLDAALYGDITRLTAYLYHYLMSFPLRFLELFSVDERFIITSLRFLNVAMVVGALIGFRKLFLDNGISRRVAHVSLVIFMSLPILSLLAAEINYDNAMLLIAPFFYLYVLRVARGKDNVAFNSLAMIVLAILATLIKDTFGVIALISVVVALGALIFSRRHKVLGLYRRALAVQSSRMPFAILLFAGIVLSGLALERYGGNLLEYGHLRTRCEEVQTVQVCDEYMPWHRNQQNLQTRPAVLPYDFQEFTDYWLEQIYDGYFATFSHAPSLVVSIHEPYGPIVLKSIMDPLFYVGALGTIAGAVLMVWQGRKLWRIHFFRYGLLIAVGYVATVFFFNYQTYLKLGAPQAIQARYTLPVLLFIIAAIVQSASWTVGRQWIMKAGVTIALLACFVLPGGVMNRVVWADATWVWPQKQLIDTSLEMRRISRYLFNP